MPRPCSVPVVVGTLVAALFAISPARAEACFIDDGKPPAQSLTGMLQYVRPLPPFPYPAMEKPFYTLDLTRATCLKDEAGEVLHEGVKSIHVYAKDDRREALLRKYRNRRVAVMFDIVFAELTAHHRRPIVGLLATIRPAR